jgi:hypothetical protein
MAGARTKRARRLANIFDVDALRDGETAMNRSWMMQRAGDSEWYWVPIGISVHEAGDLVDESNFEVAERLIEAASDFGDFRYRYDNWVGPQVRTLMVRVDDAGALRAALDILKGLSDYPVLDDADLSEREAAETFEFWDESQRGDVQSLMTSEYEVPEGLFWGGWRELPEISDEDFDAIAFECEAWQNASYDDTVDLDELAGQVAAALRVALCGEGADVKAHRECACCGMPTYGPVWALCDGCEHDGECDAEEAWHCTGEFEHACDGTACPQSQEEADADAEEAARREAERMMTPLF